MTTSTTLPRVLLVTPPNSSLSMERALKQVLMLLESYVDTGNDPAIEDALNASIDDVNVMLQHLG